MGYGIENSYSYAPSLNCATCPILLLEESYVAFWNMLWQFQKRWVFALCGQKSITCNFFQYQSGVWKHINWRITVINSLMSGHDLIYSAINCCFVCFQHCVVKINQTIVISIWSHLICKFSSKIIFKEKLFPNTILGACTDRGKDSSGSVKIICPSLQINFSI